MPAKLIEAKYDVALIDQQKSGSDMSQQQASVSEHQAQARAVHTGHPTPATYFKVAITLLVITAAEVAVFYVTALGRGIIPVLAILSIVKFALVAMFYMHLRYDARLFSGLFLFGLFLAGAVVFALIMLFQLFI